jgi:hypothetical protein
LKGKNPIPAFGLTGLHAPGNALAKLLKSKTENVGRRYLVSYYAQHCSFTSALQLRGLRHWLAAPILNLSECTSEKMG